MVKTERTNADVLVILIEGRLDAASRPIVEPAITRALQSVPCAIVDLSGVSFVGSEGLRLFLMFRKQPDMGRMLLCSMQDPVREVFEISGLVSLFDVFAARDEAELAARSYAS